MIEHSQKSLTVVVVVVVAVIVLVVVVVVVIVVIVMVVVYLLRNAKECACRHSNTFVHVVILVLLSFQQFYEHPLRQYIVENNTNP